MHSVRKIIAPIDLAIDSELPIQHAIGIADAMGAELTLLHVAGRDAGRNAGQAWWPPYTTGGESREIHRLVIAGDPSETISRYAGFLDADMVLITSENSRDRMRFGKPSVTDQVMRSTSKPVYFNSLRSVQRDARLRFQRILCVLNLDGMDGPVVDAACELAETFRGELILLSAIPNIDEDQLFEPFDGMDRPLSRWLALERIRVLRERISVPYKTSVMRGTASRCVPLAAREHSVDIVVALRSTSVWPAAYAPNIRSLQRSLWCPVISIAGILPAARPVEETVGHADLELSSVSGF